MGRSWSNNTSSVRTIADNSGAVKDRERTIKGRIDMAFSVNYGIRARTEPRSD